MLPAFKDERYLCVDGKLLFFIYVPEEPAIKDFIKCWRELAKIEGLKGFYFVAIGRVSSLRNTVKPKEKIESLISKGFDAVNTWNYTQAEVEAGRFKKYFHAVMGKLFGIEMISKIKQSEINKHMYIEEDKQENVFPLLFPNWDCAPRKGKECTIYTDSTPEEFEKQIKHVKELLANKKPEHRIAILKSWNEWGEGNYVEPDIKYGRGYLDVLHKQLVLEI